MRLKGLLNLLAPLAWAASAWAAGAASFAVNPSLPSYGQQVTIELRDMTTPTYQPAARYTRSGSTITVDFEYVSDGFGPWPPGFGPGTLTLGELVPGNYTVNVRLFDMMNSKAPAQVMSRTLAVMPPQSWGLYLIPQEPSGFTPWNVMVRSAAYFDPATLRARLEGNVVRIEFDYQGDAPASGAAPPGMTTFAAVTVPPVQPGNYRVEGWGRDRVSGNTERYFTKDVTVASSVNVVEYYAPSLDHYFMAAGADEIALLDAGRQGGWHRTGLQFKAWMRPADAPPGAQPVCRFYARGPNSHFYTGDPRECDFLKALEHQQRAEASARGEPFLGWQYEGIAFYSMLPGNGACPGGMQPVYRTYNGRARENDSNHRFTADPGQRAAMTVTWVDEGVAFCSPS